MTLRAVGGKTAAAWLFAMVLVYSVYLHRRLGMDGFWDTANYHWYLGWAFWSVSSYNVGAAAQYQTFLNPVIDAVNYALFSLHPFLGAAFHSVCLALTIVVVYRIAGNVVGPDESRRFGPVLAAISAATGAMTVSLFGSLTNEHITALLILAGLDLMVRQDAMHDRKASLGAGLLMGLATGLKLTAAPYVAGMLVTAALVSKMNIRTLFLIGVGGALGLLLADGVFMALRWDVYRNPLFPLANNIFHSPYFPLEWKSFSQFELRMLPYYLSLPIRWLYSGDLSESNMVRDGRLLLGYIGLALAFFSAMVQRRKLRDEERIVIFFFIFSWLAWILFFRIYRYLVVLEMISGVVFVIGLLRVVPAGGTWQRTAAPLLSLVFLAIVTVYPDWGRRPWHREFASSNVTALIASDKTNVVFFSDERVSYLAPELEGKAIPFRNLFAQSWYDGDRKGNPIDPRPIALSRESRAYFLQYSMDDPRTKSAYLSRLFNRHLFTCEQSATNMLWSPYLCRFDEISNLPTIELGTAYDYASPALVFGSGWSPAETGFRWTEGRASSIWVSLPALPAACPLSVSIKGTTLGRQRIDLSVAGQTLLDREFAGTVDTALRIDTTMQASGGAVEINFNLPDAATPNNGDVRQLAFAFQSLRFQCD